MLYAEAMSLAENMVLGSRTADMGSLFCFYYVCAMRYAHRAFAGGSSSF